MKKTKSFIDNNYEKFNSLLRWQCLMFKAEDIDSEVVEFLKKRYADNKSFTYNKIIIGYAHFANKGETIYVEKVFKYAAEFAEDIKK